jgi:general secretion pathway protein E
MLPQPWSDDHDAAEPPAAARLTTPRTTAPFVRTDVRPGAPIGQLLVERRVVSAADLDQALSFQRQYGGRLGSILVRLGALSEDALLPVLASQTGFALIADAALPEAAQLVDAIAASGIPIDWFDEQGVVIWLDDEKHVHCASRNPMNSYSQETIGLAFPDRRVVWFYARSRDTERLLKGARLEAGDEVESYDVAHLRELAEEAPVIELVNNLMAEATDQGASDIHVEPDEHAFEVRFRIDGTLRVNAAHAKDRFDAVVSRIKLIAGLDIAERRLPQDGRITVRTSGTAMDIRVSVIPGVHGESIVMRLLPKERANLELSRLGMEADHRALFERWVKEPHGIILVTGPTGSGKSTTLYAALDLANDRASKIITVEDPVEYKMHGILQIQTHGEIGYDFARALRAILRHDPDIIMIGEIRDVETAEIAIQSALTGHMVLSTLHTNDALGAFNRLLDMGVEPFLVASSVRGVQAQRLVRKLCTHCAKPAPAPLPIAATLAQLQRRYPDLFAGQANFREPVGCGHCHQSGFQGRLGVYELYEVDGGMQELVMRRASSGELLEFAGGTGMRTMREDGLVKAWRGETSVDEVMRVTGLAHLDEAMET